MRINKYIPATLLFALALWSCDRDKEIYEAKPEPKYDGNPVHILNDLSQYENATLSGTEKPFLNFLEAEQQYLTKSYTGVERLKGRIGNVSALNVFLNMTVGEEYDEADRQTFDATLANGAGLGFFAMGAGNAQRYNTWLSNTYGFAFQQAAPATTTDEGANLNGTVYSLDLQDGSWEILAKAGGQPVVAIKEVKTANATGKVLACGVDIFSAGADGTNKALYQKILSEMTEYSDGFFSPDKEKTVLGREFNSEATDASFAANKYIKLRAEAIQPLYEEVLAELKNVMTVEKGVADNINFNIISTDSPGWVDGTTINIGAYFGGFPDNTDAMKINLAQLTEKVWARPLEEPFEQEAFSKYLIAKVSANLGIEEPYDMVKDQMAKARDDERYRTYDPVSMSADEQAGYPEFLRHGKLFFVLDSLEKAYPDLNIIGKYFETKRKKIPVFEGFNYTAHDFMWALGDATEDDDFLQNVKNNTGYALDETKISTPHAYDRIILNPIGWKATSEATIRSNANRPEHLFDGYPDKAGGFWHSMWQNPVPPFPHEIIIDMKKTHRVMGFRFLPWQNWRKDMIMDMDIFISLDGQDWGEPIATFKHGPFHDPAWQELYCSSYKDARYVKISIKKMFRTAGTIGENHDESNMHEFQVYSLAK
ncbi:hypothetical protein FUAX_07410 [Fulvitalea axinellae]|uniref:F5/8 type C domain-containing protein n=1 Tax=Fulvitalea axinellae TaxID=1182444 RepID=A0AAU9C8K4_9BACT|nr:hypothetical protein FUAX_07410 [Fulvitalea axinellae]